VILESIITTLDDDGAVRIAPMGPEVSDGFDHFVLRPFQTSRTYANLRRTRQGVLHVTDDVELMARAAIGQFEQVPRHRPAPVIHGVILEDACRWYAFEVESMDDREPRASLYCRVVGEGRQRDFLGFNRARHAVVEVAILVTRLALVPPDTVLAEMRRLEPLVEKTGGPAERRAFGLLRQFVYEHCDLHVRAPSRLHFGLFSFGNPGRQFGGVGVMVAQPALHLIIRPADAFTTSGPLADELFTCAQRCCDVWGLPGLPSCRIELESAPPRHVGLGSGTQLACAVVTGLGAWYRRPPLSPEDLARATGRGRRSAVGTYGFVHGGLIVESGRLPDDVLSPLERRLAVPAAWRFVLVECDQQAGLAGLDEQQAFAQLPPVSDAVRLAMREEVERHMIPAVVAEDCQAFGDSVYRYGHRAGLSFAAVQGGPYNGPYVTGLVEEIRALGYMGVGQSSWGPTVFCVVENDDVAERLKRELLSRRHGEHLDILITSADNRGAVVERSE
jgi:beta-ribofuranosylaminobenzene 5'-phosphate synthase